MKKHRYKPAPRAPQLSAARRMMVYVIGLGVWLSGAIWVLLHYFFMTEGPFGPSPNPLEFWSLASHGAFAFATLWLLGVMWVVHIPAGWRSLRRRWSGSLTFGVAGWLVLSGFLLYYAGSEEMVSAVAILHWSIGLVCPLVFLVHRMSSEKTRQSVETERAHGLRADHRHTI